MVSQVLRFLLLFGVSHAVAADAVQVSASVDRAVLASTDTLQLTITVNAVQEVEAPNLGNAVANDFDVLSQGSTSNIQLINGRMSAQTIYQFLLSPKRDGTLTIPAIAVEVGGQRYYSEPIAITVGVATASPVPAPSVLAEGDYFVTAAVSTTAPVVNEQILYTFRFYTRVQVDEARLELPDFADFFKEEVVPERKFYEESSAGRYVVTEKVFALFASKEGTVTIDAAVLQLSLPRALSGRWFGLPGAAETKVLKTKSFAIDVKPLPPEPAHFSNLVGTFSLGLSVDKQTLGTGESATISVEVRGVGNIGDAVLPPWPFPPQFKVYEDQPELTTEKSPQGVKGVKRFKRAIVPTEPGQYTIPALLIDVFNPESDAYETISTAALVIDVSGDALPSAQLGSSQPSVRAPSSQTASEFKPIASLRAPLLPSLEVLSFEWIAIILLIPPLLFVGLAVGLRVRRHRQIHALAYRRARAWKTAKRELKCARVKSVTPVAIERALRIVRDYIAAKQQRPSGQALSSGEIEHILMRSALPEDNRDTVIGVLRAWEAGLYGGKSLSAQQFNESLQELTAALERMDEQL